MAWEIAKGILIAVAILFIVVPLALGVCPNIRSQLADWGQIGFHFKTLNSAAFRRGPEVGHFCMQAE
jgi:hypothetical protein